jgi:predicted DNA-binding transcriptional regulator AlpA
LPELAPPGVVSWFNTLPIHLHVKAPDSPPHEPLIGITELADWLGVSAHTVKKWASAGPASKKIPRLIRLNGVTRFDPADVRAWINSKAVEE